MPGLPVPIRPAHLLNLLVALLVATAAAALPATSSAARVPTAPALTRTAFAPGSWAAHYVVGPTPVIDSQGTTWQPATGVTGGSLVQGYGGIGDTGSPQLYTLSRQGITSWTVPVPGPGRYSIDLLFADLTNQYAGARVFTVTASDAWGAIDSSGSIDIARFAGWYHPYHYSSVVGVRTGSSVRFTFAATIGTTTISALSVISDGPQTAQRTLLDENFDGPAGTPPPAIWSPTLGSGWEQNTVETYTAASNQLDGNGHLAITAYAQGNGTYTSGRLQTSGTFSFGYGVVSARIQIPTGDGIFPAFWAVGATAGVDWPQVGEMDLMEGALPASTVNAHVHSLGDSTDPESGYQGYREASLGREWDTGSSLGGAFHVYSARYAPGAITFYLDGTRYFTAAIEDLRSGEGWPFNGAPFYLILNLQLGAMPWTGYTSAASVGAGKTMLVDWVRVTT